MSNSFIHFLYLNRKVVEVKEDVQTNLRQLHTDLALVLAINHNIVLHSAAKRRTVKYTLCTFFTLLLMITSCPEKSQGRRFLLGTNNGMIIRMIVFSDGLNKLHSWLTLLLSSQSGRLWLLRTLSVCVSVCVFVCPAFTAYI